MAAASRGQKLATRIGLGAVMIAIVVGAFALEVWLAARQPAGSVMPMLFSTAILAALAAAGAAETTRLLAGTGIASDSRWCALGGALLTFAALPWLEGGRVAVGAIVFAVWILAPLSRAVFVPTDDIAKRMAGNALALFYVPFLLGFLVRIRALPAPVDGLYLLLAIVLATKASDIFAYLTGFAIGRHQAIPRISPGKTWEGYAGGLVGCLIVGWILIGVNPFGAPPVTAGTAAALVAVIALLSPLGDLMESLLKRSAAVKDSGHLLPEFGGVLDLVDSLVVVAPAAYLVLEVGT